MALFLYLCECIWGCPGFDSKMRWYVSMQSVVVRLLKTATTFIIGENKYALAA